MPLKFRSGTNILVYGVSNSGKSTFVLKVLKERLITKMPKKILYFYKVKQDIFEEYNKVANTRIQFIEGLPDNVYDLKDSIVVFDDLLLHNNATKLVSELFVYHSHHLQITAIFLSQNLYPKDEHFRLMVLNSHYMVLHGDIRSMRQIKTLANQIFTDEDKTRLLNAYRQSIKAEYGFVVLCFVKNIPRELTILTNYWDSNPSVYL